jgi:hypothetical protein
MIFTRSPTLGARVPRLGGSNAPSRSRDLMAVMTPSGIRAGSSLPLCVMPLQLDAGEAMAGEERNELGSQRQVKLSRTAIEMV